MKKRWLFLCALPLVCVITAIALWLAGPALLVGRGNLSLSAGNPIDAYYLPLIQDAFPEAARRELQDSYYGVWLLEYENVIAWTRTLCVDEAWQAELAFDSGVHALSDNLRTLLTAGYPDGGDSAGARGAVSQAAGEHFRDISMLLIRNFGGGYEFLEQDYSTLLCEGDPHAGEPETRPPSVYLDENNPIDAYFDTWVQVGFGTTLEARVYAVNCAEAWKAEILHAYDLLIEKAHPTIGYPREYIAASRDNFLEYAENDGWMRAYLENSDAFGDESGTYGAQISTGTILPATASLTRMQHYREQTFYLYDLLAHLDVAPDFIFDPAVLDELRSADW